MIKFVAAVGFGIISTFSLSAAAQSPLPPIEAYGAMPIVRSVEISPDGSKAGYILSKDNKEIFVVTDFKKQSSQGLDASNIKSQSVDFLNNDFVVLTASETDRKLGFRHKQEYSAAFSYNTKKDKIVQLLKQDVSSSPSNIKRDIPIHPGQTGLGKIVGNLTQKNQVLMPAYIGKATNPIPPYDLLSVSPEHGRYRKFESGKHSTIDWFVTTKGTILAREDFDDKNNIYTISTKRNGKWEIVYERKNSPLLPFDLIGMMPDESALLVVKRLPDGSGEGLFALNWDGSFSDQLLAKENVEIDHWMIDTNRKIYGVQYSGMRPSYAFFDNNINTNITSLIEAHPGFAIKLVSWTSDWKKLVIQVSGGTESGSYHIYDTQSKSLTKLADSRSIPKEWIGEAITIEYAAKDGTKIPALLTWPASDGPREKLPTIILPHGGPESYDQLDFHWLSQYFASRGYLVLQPNFRGSTGFGPKFMFEGRGEWGGLMQEDIKDGLNALIKGGYADPDKVCIVGASYGGYAALAGGAFSPDLYRCVAAIAPVTDIPRLLRNEELQHGGNSWVADYWDRVIGTNKGKLETISPVNHAASFSAPVLLVHGNDDTVVDISQSSLMKNALERSGKNVEFIKIKGGDHWLSTSDTRLDTLKALDTFIAKHNPAN